jgi:nitrous oxidase accessory protein
MNGRLFAAGFLAGLALCSSRSAAESRVLHVRGTAGGISLNQQHSNEFTSIPAALNAACSGDTIRVYPGIYTGNIHLTKSVHLEGVGKPILRGEARQSVVTVTAPECVIRGFTIERCGNDLQQENSGILIKSNRNRVEENELQDILYGIYLLRSQNNVIRQNLIRGRRNLPEGERGAGIHLWDSPGNRIEENDIAYMRDGMYIQNSSDNIITRNRVTHLRYGLHYMYSDANRFEENFFSDNMAGAAIMYSRRIVFRRNAFLRNRGFSSFGILFQDCEECLAENNYIIANATGIFMEALRRSVLRNNVIAENDIAFQIFSNSDDNVISGNNLIENLSPLLLIGRKTTLRWEENGRGNYWSEYKGYDLDGDGVGDRPHKVQNAFEYLEGNYPRLRLYLYSPAAQALAMADKTFPVVPGSSEVDRTPLISAVRLRYPFKTDHRQKRVHVPLLSFSMGMLMLSLWMIRKCQL